MHTLVEIESEKQARVSVWRERGIYGNRNERNKRRYSRLLYFYPHLRILLTLPYTFISSFFIFQFNMMEDKEDQSLLYQLNGKIIESEFLACCMCSSFKWDYGNGKNSFYYVYIHKCGIFNSEKRKIARQLTFFSETIEGKWNLKRVVNWFGIGLCCGAFYGDLEIEFV